MTALLEEPSAAPRVAGADVQVWLDLRDLSVTGPGPPVWTEVSCEVTSAEWTWGAVQPLGPLTECEGGTLRVSLYDPARKYDPSNPDSPYLGVLLEGMKMRTTVDGAPAFTGALSSWSHPLPGDISDLFGIDALGELATRQLPRSAQTILGQTDVQVQNLLDQVEWPANRRYFPTTGGVLRGAALLKASLLDMLQLIRFTELGALFPMRDGRIGWWNRAGPALPPVSAIINCGGVGLVSLYKVRNPNKVRNRVKFSSSYGIYGGVGLVEHIVREANPNTLEVHLGWPDAPANPPWPVWAYVVLDALAEPEPEWWLGTIVPMNGEVAQIVCAEFGDRWTVNTPTESREVVVLGMTVSVTPETIEVDAVTDLVKIDDGSRHAIVYGGSQQAANNDAEVRAEAEELGVALSDANYAIARQGTGARILTGAAPAEGYPLQLVGQHLTATPGFVSCAEMFVRFDTGSVLPDNAIVDRVDLVTWQEPPPAVAVTLYARAKAWGPPPLATADWVAGGSLTTLPLRATLTNPGGPVQPPDAYAVSAWQRWTSDASFAANVNKTGYTELLIHTDRHATGIKPVVGQEERVGIHAGETNQPLFSGPYLDITYHLPAAERERQRPRTALHMPGPDGE